MFDEMEALRALDETGTTGRAAVRLRISQSAVSKRVHALEARLGRQLVEPVGRRIRLTPEGRMFLDEAGPLLRRLAELLDVEPGPGRLRVAASHSLLASWLPEVLARAAAAAHLELDLRVHRGPAVLEWLRSGELELAVCAEGDTDASLEVVQLGSEPMVIVPSGLVPFQPSGVVPVITVEPHSLTWAALAPRVARRARAWGWSVEPTRTIESFPAVVRLALAGFGHGLVPLPLAIASGVPAELCVPFPPPGLDRAVVVAARRRTLARPAVRVFVDVLARTNPLPDNPFSSPTP